MPRWSCQEGNEEGGVLSDRLALDRRSPGRLGNRIVPGFRASISARRRVEHREVEHREIGSLVEHSDPTGCVEYADYMHWVGSAALPGQAYNVALSGNQACVAMGTDGVLVLDVT